MKAQQKSIPFFSRKEALLTKPRSYQKHHPTLLEGVAPSGLYREIEPLARKANEYHHKSQNAQNRSLQHAKSAGEALIAAKRALGVGAPRKERAQYGPTKGRWERWLAEFFQGSAETARVYMRIAKHWDDPAIRTARLNGLEPKTMNGFLSLVRKPIPAPEAVKMESDIAKFIDLVRAELAELDAGSVHDRAKIDAMVKRFPSLWGRMDEGIDDALTDERHTAAMTRVGDALNGRLVRRKRRA